jgi:hypothetical protein
MHTRIGAALLAMTISMTGCDLDLVNPNSPTEATVLNDADAIIGLAVGIQQQYASSVRDYTLPSALLTDEWGPRSRALAADKSMFAGTPDASFGIVSAPFGSTYQIVRTANNLLEHAPQVGLGAGLQAGILAVARLHKAMALGAAIQIYEQVPVALAIEGSAPQPRAVVLDTVLALLEAARSDLQGVSDADLAGFRARALDPGINLRSSIDAMLARYYLIDGQYDQALAAAQRADDENASVYTFSGTAQSPIYQYSIGLDYVWPLLSFAREADAGDQRVGFWTDTTSVDVLVTPTLASPVAHTDRSAPFPLYMPDEMRLIRAEVDARQGSLQQALDEINAVRTQCTAGVADPAPCLAPLTLADVPTQDAMLAQIAYERRYELFLTGLRWEDLRRLGQFTGDAAKINFLPFPQRECDVNPNFPC